MAAQVLHFNDCAFVARSLVDAARRKGVYWRYLPPEKVRPKAVTATGLRAKYQYFPYWLRRLSAVSKAELVHVHYGTSARLLRDIGIPRRPYVLTLHGSDIRRQWKEPRYHAEIQRAIDEAAHVFYANIDTEANARAAREDAEFLPALVDGEKLPLWKPELSRPSILFVSRWDEDKGVEKQLELASMLTKAVGPKVRVLGLDWGPGAQAARRAGVELLPRMPQPSFLQVMAQAHVGIGQATNNFATSEFEALCMGLPMAALGNRMPRPDDGAVPPVLEGGVTDVVEQVLAALADPIRTSDQLGGAVWARPRYDAAGYVDRLDSLYTALVPRSALL